MKFSEVIADLDSANREEVLETQWKGAKVFWELNEEIVERKLNLEWALRLFGATDVISEKANEWVLSTGSVMRYVDSRLVRIFNR